MNRYTEERHIISKMQNCYENLELSSESRSFFEQIKSRDLLKKNSIPINVTYFMQIVNEIFGQKLSVFPGMQISLKHTGRYQCASCNKEVKKIYSGFCYVCLTTRASADTCVMSPHRCHYMKGTCREEKWGEEFCYTPHFVYLAYTDKFKVGITRQSHIPYRWMDQGATSAVLLARVTSRNQAGVVEKALTEILSDRSHWKKMLQSANNRPSAQDFLTKFNAVCSWLSEKLSTHPDLIVSTPEHLHLGNKIEVFEKPVVLELNYPLPLESRDTSAHFQSVSLEKEKEISGKILGIKGQYLIFENRVFNVRSHEGFIVNLESFV